MYELTGAKDNRVNDKLLPKRMMISKCPSSENSSPDDTMAFKIKVLSQGSMFEIKWS